MIDDLSEINLFERPNLHPFQPQNNLTYNVLLLILIFCFKHTRPPINRVVFRSISSRYFGKREDSGPGNKVNSIYSLAVIDPDGSGAFDVFCDQKTAGGGWTVFQKRLDGSVDFYRGWNDYKRGFGNLNGEFWLGLDKIHRLTKTRNKLRVDLEDTTGNTVYAEYDMFAVTSERTKYQLSLGTFSVNDLKKGPHLKSFNRNKF